MYDFCDVIKILLAQENKNWEKEDLAWHFSQVVKNINEFERLYFKEDKYKEAKSTIEETGVLLYMMASKIAKSKKPKKIKKKINK